MSRWGANGGVYYNQGRIDFHIYKYVNLIEERLNELLLKDNIKEM